MIGFIFFNVFVWLFAFSLGEVVPIQKGHGIPRGCYINTDEGTLICPDLGYRESPNVPPAPIDPPVPVPAPPKASSSPEQLERMKMRQYCAQLTRFRFENFYSVEDWVVGLYQKEYQRYLERIPRVCRKFIRESGHEPDVVIQPDLSLINDETQTWKDPEEGRAIFWGNKG